jgi:photosystem II stability/assembly factor-like uncharacterized protein
VPSQTVTALAVDPIVPQNVYLASPSGLFRSTDGGLTWVGLKAQLDSAPMALTLDPRHPATLFALLTSGTLLRCDDGGATWAPRELGQ